LAPLEPQPAATAATAADAITAIARRERIATMRKMIACRPQRSAGSPALVRAVRKLFSDPTDEFLPPASSDLM